MSISIDTAFITASATYMPAGKKKSRADIDATEVDNSLVSATSRQSPIYDKVNISPDAKAKSQQADDAKHTANVVQVASLAPEDIEWGPDLLDGWDDANYLKLAEGGYTGSMSFTSKYGSKVNVSAGSNEDGTPSTDIHITVVRANGDTYQTMLDHTLRITETEDSIDFSTSSRGTDGDDIIISKGFSMSGGKGDDTLISIGIPGQSTDPSRLYSDDELQIMDGGEGDDTLVSLGAVTNDKVVKTGSGHDRVNLRTYEAGVTQGLHLGKGKNTVVMDHLTRGAHLYIINKEENNYHIRQFDGNMLAMGHGKNTFVIEELNGNLFAHGNNDMNNFYENADIGLTNVFTIGTVNGRLLSYANATVDIQTVNGDVGIVSGSGNKVTVGQVSQSGHLTVRNGDLSINSSEGTLGCINGTLTANNISGSLFLGGTAAIENFSGIMMAGGDTTLNIVNATGTLLLSDTVSGTIQNMSGNIYADTLSLSLKIDSMTDTRMLLNSGIFDIHVNKTKKSFVAAAAYGDANAQGKFTIDYAEESVFLGYGFNIKASKDCIETMNRNVWHAAERYGVKGALSFLRRFGEDAFDGNGALRPEFIKMMAR